MPPSLRSMIPAAYDQSATSGLRVSVKSGRNKGPAFSFDLRADYKGPAK